MKILAIETSCDETSCAIYDDKKGLLSNVVASQIDIHAKTGGVVPEVASRAHVEQILPVIDEALKLTKTSLTKIDYIAVTHAPGLIGSLLVGVNTAKTLSVVLNKPVIPINHLEGHIYANFIGQNPKSEILNSKQAQNSKSQKTNLGFSASNFEFPAIILLVSGGHTSLILMKDHGKYKYLGETLDDAAGEAFDKVARVLELPYPGGPNISRMADSYRKKFQISNNKLQTNLKSQNPKLGNGNFFPRSMLDSGDFNFSFSGLKTAVLYAWQKVSENGGRTLRRSEATGKGPTSVEAMKRLFTYEFEEAVVDILATKTISAAKKYKVKTVSICGGVAANKRLREEIDLRVRKELKNVSFCVPPIQYCGDNAAMIACAANYKTKKLKKEEIKKLRNLYFEVMSNKEL